MGAGAEGACVVVSRGDGEAQWQRWGDHEALRWGADGAEIVADLESTFATTGLEKDVQAFMAMAVDKRWLEMRP